MGTQGVAIFSDDLAADIRDDFRELIGDGLSPSEATDRLLEEYKSSLGDADEMPVFWIALALSQWKLGRLEDRTKAMALELIDSGADLARWDDPKNHAKRKDVLEKVRDQLLSDSPPAKPVSRTIKESNDWQIGEMIGFQLSSGRWTVFRVIGHHTDKGGRFAVCELLNWVGEALPGGEILSGLQILTEASPRGISQFLFQVPRKKQDQVRVVRMGLRTDPQQSKGAYAALVWPYVDQQMESIFNLR